MVENRTDPGPEEVAKLQALLDLGNYERALKICNGKAAKAKTWFYSPIKAYCLMK